MLFNEICQNIALSADGSFISLLISLVLLAFVGSFSHCTFMCGPFVMAQISANISDKSIKNQQVSEWKRLKGAALLPYHLGRISTYSLLGGISGLIGSSIKNIWLPFSGVILLITGIIFIIYAFNNKYLNKTLNFKFFHKIINIQAIKRLRTNLAYSNSKLKSYTLGIILGFIPCSMVYIALTAAATTASFSEGFLAMMLFGISTIPALFTLGLFGKYITANIKVKFKLFNKIALTIAGIWLCYIAINILKQ